MAKSSEQFRFSKVYPGSEIAAILNPPDDIWDRCTIYACEAHRCPVCKAKSLYFIPVRRGFDLFAPENSTALIAVTARAMDHGYICPNCEIEWCDLTRWYLIKAGIDMTERADC